MHAKTQAARYVRGELPRQDTGQLIQSMGEAPPAASRLNTRPVVNDRWGFGSLADADQGRVVEPAQEKGTSPLILAALGFLGAKFFFR